MIDNLCSRLNGIFIQYEALDVLKDITCLIKQVNAIWAGSIVISCHIS